MQQKFHFLQYYLQRNTKIYVQGCSLKQFEENWEGPKCPGSINYGATIQWTTLQL